MALGGRVRIFGLPELSRKLNGLSRDQGHMIENALMTGAIPLETRWKELTPVRTGTYRRSIHREVISRGRDRASVMVGTNLTAPPYPVYLEFGTRNMPARPSARPAWDSTRRQVESEIRRAYEFQLRSRGIR